MEMDDWETTPLHALVATRPSLAMVPEFNRLLQMGANLEARDFNGYTPFLRFLLGVATLEVTAFMVDAGVNIHAITDDGRGALHILIDRAAIGINDWCPRTAIAEYLITLGCDPTIPNRHGICPLELIGMFPHHPPAFAAIMDERERKSPLDDEYVCSIRYAVYFREPLLHRLLFAN